MLSLAAILAGLGLVAGRPVGRPLPAVHPARVWPGQGDPAVERARLCIIQREAGGDYSAVDPTGTWFGAYQLQLRTSAFAARRMHRPELARVPANRWSAADQDAAFYVVYDRGRGRHHWFGGRFPCF